MEFQLPRQTWLALVTLLFTAIVNAEDSTTTPDYLYIELRDDSIQTLGEHPLDRQWYARAIDLAREQGARNLILKFFLDSPTTHKSDNLLISAAKGFDVYLQADYLDDLLLNVNQPFNVFRPDLARTDILKDLESLSKAYYPLDELGSAAVAVGFAHGRVTDQHNVVNLLAEVEGQVVASMLLLALETITGDNAEINGRQLKVGRFTYELAPHGTATCEYLANGDLRSNRYSLEALLSGAIPKTDIEGKTLILGYGRSDIHKFSYGWLGLRKIKAHDLWLKQLDCLLGI